jgi:hypothetical protein
MSKKKGLGRDIENSMEIMEELSGCLDKFLHSKLQKGLKSNRIDDGDLEKKIEKALIDSSALGILLDSIQRNISGAKPKASARFASQRVLSKFLARDEN